MKIWRYGYEFGPFQIETGLTLVTRWELLTPDGSLHIWWGKRGVHLFWQRSQYQRRVVFDRL